MGPKPDLLYSLATPRRSRAFSRFVRAGFPRHHASSRTAGIVVREYDIFVVGRDIPIAKNARHPSGARQFTAFAGIQELPALGSG